MISPRLILEFDEYLEFYPSSNEEGYDGIHDGGIKGLRDDAPESAKKAFQEYLNIENSLKRSPKKD